MAIDVADAVCRMRSAALLLLVVLLQHASGLAVPAPAATPFSVRFGEKPPALSLQAPAKVNLFLRVLQKREDGFHELASLFQTVSLLDRLDFWEEEPDASQPICTMEVSPDSVGRAGIPTDEQNLVMRALALYAERTGRKQRVHCRLHKAIPAQAGMGGGSADCATALHAANRLAGSAVPQSTLIEWAGELGSDIGFFFSRGSAYCTGRGEQITNIDPLRWISSSTPVPSTPRVYLVKPAAGCSTPLVFRAMGLSKGEPLAGLQPIDLLAPFEANVRTATYVNDLERPAIQVLPVIAELKYELMKLGLFDAVMMSGSGSTIFCLGEAPLSIDAGGDGPRTWQETIQSKFEGVQIFEAAFCQRPEDEALWYGE